MNTIEKIIRLSEDYGATRLILFGSYAETPSDAGDIDLAWTGFIRTGRKGKIVMQLNI